MLLFRKLSDFLEKHMQKSSFLSRDIGQCLSKVVPISQYGSVSGYESDFAIINCDIPQGSVLRSLLFLLHTKWA